MSGPVALPRLALGRTGAGRACSRHRRWARSCSGGLDHVMSKPFFRRQPSPAGDLDCNAARGVVVEAGGDVGAECRRPPASMARDANVVRAVGEAVRYRRKGCRDGLNTQRLCASRRRSSAWPWRLPSTADLGPTDAQVVFGVVRDVLGAPKPSPLPKPVVAEVDGRTVDGRAGPRARSACGTSSIRRPRSCSDRIRPAGRAPSFRLAQRTRSRRRRCRRRRSTLAPSQRRAAESSIRWPGWPREAPRTSRSPRTYPSCRPTRSRRSSSRLGR